MCDSFFRTTVIEIISEDKNYNDNKDYDAAVNYGDPQRHHN